MSTGDADKHETSYGPHEDQIVVARPSFADLYRREYPGLVAVATALSGDHAEAEDLVQDTMVKALVRWSRVQALQKPGGWCHRVLIHACRSWFRRGQTQRAFLVRQRVGDIRVAGPSPEAVAFWTAARRLPERQRVAVAMYYAGDRPVAEIAEIMGVPEGTINSDLARARKALAGMLKDAE